ncbi:MAG: pentapeptide repeat-containing protein [Rhodobacteraceae bacterium]|nr:pentapeptide repeat-containing protein [Paracoccaceae bacterium]
MGESRDDAASPPAGRPPEAGVPPVFMILVFAFGIAAGLFLALAGIGVIEEGLGLILTVFAAALTVVAIVGALVILFRRPILQRVFGVAETQIDALAMPLSRLAERAMAADPPGATAAARDFAQLALARYAWIATRRWIVASLTALIAAMAALAGTALLYKQNLLLGVQTALLEEQNRKIEAQTTLLSQQVELAEAARNAEIAVAITALAAEVGAAANASAAALPQDPLPDAAENGTYARLVPHIDPVTGLDRGLSMRIVALSRSARPYRFLRQTLDAGDSSQSLRVALSRRRADLPQTWDRLAAANGWAEEGPAALIDRPASPERGALLDMLVGGGLRNLEILNHFGLDLSFAWLPGARLFMVTAQTGMLAYADLSGASLVGCDFGGADLSNARLAGATVSRTDFSDVPAGRLRPPFAADLAPLESILTGVSFAGAVVTDSRFGGAMMLAADFDGAILSRVDFSGASLGAATFRRAVILDADFAGADLKSADFDGAVVFGADALERIARAAAPGRFRADRFRLEPLAPSDVMTIPLVARTLTQDGLAAATGGRAPFRVLRTGAFED